MTRIAVVLIALALFPWTAGEYYINLASQIMIAALFAASLNLLVGYGGMTSLGHATYLGLAAYVSAWTFLKLGIGHAGAAAVPGGQNGACAARRPVAAPAGSGKSRSHHVAQGGALRILPQTVSTGVVTGVRR